MRSPSTLPPAASRGFGGVAKPLHLTAAALWLQWAMPRRSADVQRQVEQAAPNAGTASARKPRGAARRFRASRAGTRPHSATTPASLVRLLRSGGVRPGHAEDPGAARALNAASRRNRPGTVTTAMNTQDAKRIPRLHRCARSNPCRWPTCAPCSPTNPRPTLRRARRTAGRLAGAAVSSSSRRWRRLALPEPAEMREYLDRLHPEKPPRYSRRDGDAGDHCLPPAGDARRHRGHPR